MRTIFVLVCVLLISQIVQSQTLNSDTHICQRLSPAWQPYVEQGMFQGNILLAKEGRVICQHSVGFVDEAKQQAITPSSRFPIASLSKPIVATLLLKLQENGDVNLASTLDKYLPEYSASWANQVTLHHLLSNRSGLPNHFALPGWKMGRYLQTLPNNELLADIAKMELLFTPGTKYLYSNLGWLLLGEVVQQATGKGLEENLKEHVFTSTSMSNTGLVYNTQTPLVTGLRFGENSGWQPQETVHMQMFNVGAGLYSTTKDLLRFLTALHQQNLLSPKSKALIFSPDTPYAWRTETLTLSDSIQKDIHSYDGQLMGHSGIMYQVLEDNLSLIVLTNTGMGYEHKKALADDILSAYFDVPFPDRNDTPSLTLNKSILDNQWSSTLATFASRSIDDLQTAILVNDLAQQLEWSGAESKAIHLYEWLVNSFPENKRLIHQLERLCSENSFHSACQTVKPINVGMALLPLQDYERKAWRSEQPRPITTHVFFPTTEQNIEPLMLGSTHAPLFNAGNVVKGAVPMEGKHPLILMSHGTGGSAPQLLWLAEALVQQGYLVAAVNHHGNTAFESKKYPEGFLLWWERTRDLHVVKQKLLQDDRWRQSIDVNKIAVVGFSLGGYTALSALGGITDKTLFNEYCQEASNDFSCKPQPEFTNVLEAFEQVKNTPQVVNSSAQQHESYQIPDLEAAVVIAPAVVHSFKQKSLQDINTPTLFLVGSQDQIAPSTSNAEYAHSLLPNSELAVIDKGHHYSFLSQCTKRGKDILVQLCDEPHGVSRFQVHQQAINKVLSFLNQHLQ